MKYDNFPPDVNIYDFLKEEGHEIFDDEYMMIVTVLDECFDEWNVAEHNRSSLGNLFIRLSYAAIAATEAGEKGLYVDTSQFTEGFDKIIAMHKEYIDRLNKRLGD